ncbi:MAG: DUF1127 domain-containing protein [Natronospirillum sp.]
MTAQVPNTAPMMHPIRIKLPVAAMKKMAERMINRRQQRVLMELPEYLLRDIGVTRYEVAQEVNRPFWR